jgi:hypothetical protein
MSKRRNQRSLGAGNTNTMTLQELASLGYGDAQNLLDTIPSDAIVEASETGQILSIQVGPILMTSMGIQDYVESLSVDEWLQFGKHMIKLKDSIQWILGDWFNIGEGKSNQWGTKYQEGVESTNYSYSSLTKFAYVARRVEFFRRRKNLSFSHHVEVAELPPAKQEALLTKAETESWSVRQLRDAINPPTLPARLDRFSEKYTRFARFSAKMLDGAGRGERAQMADMLEDLARKIRSGDL